MSFGGFLGIGESYHPLPWRSLSYDARMGGYVVDADRARLEQAPRYMSSNMPDWNDRSYRSRVDEYGRRANRHPGLLPALEPAPAAALRGGRFFVFVLKLGANPGCGRGVQAWL